MRKSEGVLSPDKFPFLVVATDAAHVDADGATAAAYLFGYDQVDGPVVQGQCKFFTVLDAFYVVGDDTDRGNGAFVKIGVGGAGRS